MELWTSPARILPDFLILGTQRGGTTSLYNYLMTHPSVGPARRKEIHYFDRYFSRGVLWYRAHFPLHSTRWARQRETGQPYMTGEATPLYLFDPEVPARVRRRLPRARLLVLLRHPVERAFSHYHYAVRDRRESCPFDEAVRREAEALLDPAARAEKAREGFTGWTGGRCYLSRGFYAEQLERWLGFFPREQFLVMSSAEFYAEPDAALWQVCGFLGIQQWDRRAADYQRYNTSAYREKMAPETRRWLLDFFRPHNARLYQLLGQDFGWEV